MGSDTIHDGSRCRKSAYRREHSIRISELSRATGLPVPTIKYYLREGLVPPGHQTAPNQADYDQAHVRRLRLVRALREVGGLGVEAIGTIVAALDAPDRSLHQVLGSAHWALAAADRGEVPPRPDPDPGLAEGTSGAAGEVDALLDDLGWQVDPDAPDRATLAEVLTNLRLLGRPADAATLRPYAEAVDGLAAMEVAGLPDPTVREDVLEDAVVGTVVFQTALVALRRLAHEHHSARRHDGP